MTSQSPAIRSQPEPTQPISLGRGPLPVLTRIPWMAGDSTTVALATPVTTACPPALTHFEYLMGEFDLNCNEATATLEVVPPSAATTDQAKLPQRRLEPSSPPATPAPTIVQRQQRNVDWTEMVLRLDAAIEPYTRAIVLLVLIVVAAFTVLLLESSEEEMPRQLEPSLAQAQLNPASVRATRPANDAQPDQAAKPTNTNMAADATMPTAEGPGGIRPADAPPVATLSADIQPAPPEAVADSSIYPSTSLPDPTTTKLPSIEQSAEAPREARQSDPAEPIHPYK